MKLNIAIEVVQWVAHHHEEEASSMVIQLMLDRVRNKVAIAVVVAV